MRAFAFSLPVVLVCASEIGLVVWRSSSELMQHIDKNLVQLVQVNRYSSLRSTSRSLRPLRRVSVILCLLDLSFVSHCESIRPKI